MICERTVKEEEGGKGRRVVGGFLILQKERWLEGRDERARRETKDRRVDAAKIQPTTETHSFSLLHPVRTSVVRK